jgi:hypothetical protein
MEQYFEMGLQNIELEKVAQEEARNHGLLNSRSLKTHVGLFIIVV